MKAAARFVVIWGTPSDAEAFEKHYREVHIPLALTLPGLRRYALGRNVAMVRGGDPPYMVAELEWDDLDALRRAFASPAGKATAEDVGQLAQHASVRSMTYELEEQMRDS
jgi:uncharacterized protein (TIGR02118 family)